MESLHRERILNNIWLLAEKTQWNVILEEKLQAYKIFNSKMIEDLKRVSKIKAAGHVIILAQLYSRHHIRWLNIYLNLHFRLKALIGRNLCMKM